MVVFSDTYLIPVYTCIHSSVYWTSHFLQGTRKNTAKFTWSPDLYVRFDTDSDGVVSLKQVGQIMRAIGQNPSEAEIQAGTQQKNWKISRMLRGTGWQVTSFFYLFHENIFSIKKYSVKSFAFFHSNRKMSSYFVVPCGGNGKPSLAMGILKRKKKKKKRLCLLMKI